MCSSGSVPWLHCQKIAGLDYMGSVVIQRYAGECTSVDSALVVENKQNAPLIFLFKIGSFCSWVYPSHATAMAL